MIKVIDVLNGPNLNLLGRREPEICGISSLGDIEALRRKTIEKQGFALDFLQSGSESVLIEKIHAACSKAAAILINPAVSGHRFIALPDALPCFAGLVTEAHLSNIYKHEAVCHHSYISVRADYVISGCGAESYCMALEFLGDKIKKETEIAPDCHGK